MESHDFVRALRNAHKLHDKKFENQIKYQEAAYYYNNDNIGKALKLFQALGEGDMVKACYAKQYNKLMKQVAGDKTLADLKRHKSIYSKMLVLAQKMDDQKLQNNLRKTLSQL